MLNNSKLKNIKWYKYLISFSLIGILVAIFLRIITPQETIIQKTDFIQQSSKEHKKTSFNNIKFSGELPTLKNELPLVSIQQTTFSSDTLKENLIKNNNLQKKGDNFWMGESFSLSLDVLNNEYLFYSNFSQRDDLLVDKNKAINISKEYVSNNFEKLPFYIQKNKIKYFSGLEQMVETTSPKAVSIEIPFTYSIEDIPLFVEHKETAPLKILINNEYKIQKVVFQKTFIYPIPTQEMLSIISLSEALDNINNKQHGSIISAYESNTGVFSLDEIKSGDLTEVQLEYRADLDESIAYPFYRFSGELVNNEGKTIQAEIITPAVKVSE